MTAVASAPPPPPRCSGLRVLLLLLLRLEETDAVCLALHELCAQAQQPLLVRVGGSVSGAEELLHQHLGCGGRDVRLVALRVYETPNCHADWTVA